MAIKKSSSSSKSEPSSMEELLASYGVHSKALKRGDKVIGKVIAKEKNRLVLDIGGKGEAIVAEKAYQESKDYIKNLNVGDEVSASVIVSETPDGYVIVSLRNAMQEALWKDLEAIEKSSKEIMVLGKNAVTAGVIVEYNRLQGFIPSSHLGKESSKNPSSLIGKHFKVKVLELDRNDGKIVFSEREVADAEDIKEVKEAMASIVEGKVYDGVVTTVSNFGCFVSIPVAVASKTVDIEGLVHISEISWKKIESVSSVMREGDKVRVKVIGVKDDRLALSIKQAQSDPWDKVSKKYKKDTKVKGRVVRVTDFGVFVELEAGVEGLIHITKIPPGHKLTEGDEVNVYVEEIDPEARKLSLGLVLTAKPVGYK